MIKKKIIHGKIAAKLEASMWAASPLIFIRSKQQAELNITMPHKANILQQRIEFASKTERQSNKTKKQKSDTFEGCLHRRRLPSCVIVRGGWQCVCHSDSARRWRGGCLALDGGLVLAALLIHRCYLRAEGITCDPRIPVNHLLIQDAITATVFS